MSLVTSKELVRILRKKKFNGSKVDRLKVYYRPFLCPFNELLAFAGEDDSILDVGCGNGQFIYLLAEVINPRCITGIDNSEKLIVRAREYLSDIQKSPILLYSYDGINLPDTFNDVSLVYLIDVLHHIDYSKQQTFLHQLFLKMEKGSRLIIKDIDASSYLVFVNKLHDKILTGEDSKELTLATVLKILKSTGFYIEQFKTKRLLWYPHYTIEALKV
jgi:ubiquinone/menaquinone biosynthesis C-methylase UbiE